MRRILTTLTTIGFSCALLAACTGESRADAGPAPQKPLWQEPSGQTTATPNIPQSTLAPLIRKLKPAVANISTTTMVKNPHKGMMRRNPHNRGGEGGGEGGEGGADPWQEFFERFFGRQAPEMPEEFRGQSLGSGFIVNADGYVLTNNHVVKDATDIRVTLADGREFSAKVVGKDDPLDVAVIRLENAKNLPVVPLGDSDALEQGDFVLAMGSPFNLRESASFGIVSAKDRAAVTGSPYDDFIQTDAAINPGNSGGPLFNMRGEVIGINTAIVSPQIGQGIGFAVPINAAKQIIPQLVAKGKVARGYLGVSVSDLTRDLAQGFGLPPETKGAVVQQVVPKSPAAKAGIQPGDVVTSLNGHPVASSGQLTRGVALVAPGGKAALTLLRNGKKQDVTVTVAQRPPEEALARGEGAQEGEEGPQGGGAEAAKPKDVKLGVRLGQLTPEMAQQLGIEGEGGGVVVADVTPDGPASRAGLQRGDVILEVNRQKVTKPQQVVDLVKKMKAGDVALLRIRRGTAAVYLPVRIEGK